MLKPLSDKEQKLHDLMSQISDTCYKACWITGLEYSVWDALDSSNFKFGNRIMDPEILSKINELATELNGWIIWVDDETDATLDVEDWGPKFIKMDTWLSMVNTYNNANILDT